MAPSCSSGHWEPPKKVKAGILARKNRRKRAKTPETTYFAKPIYTFLETNRFKYLQSMCRANLGANLGANTRMALSLQIPNHQGVTEKRFGFFRSFSGHLVTSNRGSATTQVIGNVLGQHKMLLEYLLC